MILGHAHEPIIKAIQETAVNSTSFGAPTELEIDMAELIISMAPNVYQIRMVSSGTEACMSAVRLARGFTGRNKIIMKVDYELRLIDNQQKIASGTLTATDNYNINSNRYGTFVAEDYFTINLTKIIASNLRNSLINDLTEYHRKQKK